MRLSNDSFKTEQRNQHCRIIAQKISKRNRLRRKIPIKIDDRCPALLPSKKNYRNDGITSLLKV